RHLLGADRDLVAVAKPRASRDARAVEHHAVAAPRVLHRHLVVAHEQERVTTRDERIVERELAVRRSPDDERPGREREMVLEIPNPEPHRVSLARGSRSWRGARWTRRAARTKSRARAWARPRARRFARSRTRRTLRAAARSRRRGSAAAARAA